MRINYILIDYENVQPENLALLDKDPFRVIVFVGANQTKIAVKTAKALQPLGKKVEYIEISGNGSNALDFHIAFYIGQIAERDSSVFFHIISKDKGFIPLTEHLKSKQIAISQWTQVSEIPLLKILQATSREARIEIIINKLQQVGACKPRTIKTLSSIINSIFLKQLSEDETSSLVQEMRTKNYICVDGTKVSYALPVEEK